MKQGLRVRMPPPRATQPGGRWAHQRFDFSREGVARPGKVKFPVNTVERARDWGVKYVFALKKSDLDKCRETLVKRGCVPGSLYRSLVRTHSLTPGITPSLSLLCLSRPLALSLRAQSLSKF